ncbi:peptide chain release factor H [Flavobacteriaceae bacterium M23B6Z8]
MNKIIQLTAGKGPAECCWVVAQVLKRFLEEVKAHGLTYEILQRESGPENGTLSSVLLLVSGDTDAFLQNWIGSIKWVGKSKYRKHHKRKNWFIGLFEMEYILPQAIDEKDIAYQAIRSSGPGGQHVNKVSSAVRATYLPSGISVISQDSRSQHQNKKIARDRLTEKVHENYWMILRKREVNQWENHVHLQRGNPVRIFEGTDFKKEIKTKEFKATRKALKNDLKNELWKL